MARSSRFRHAWTCAFISALCSWSTLAHQIDIPGPAGSGIFGASTTVLPNGNIVVTDPQFSSTSEPHVGAVYLYSWRGTLISVLTGSSANDEIGNGGVVVLNNGNYVVSSYRWNNGTAAQAGAATWVNAATGLSGVVSDANSLVGASAGDLVGFLGRITPLRNGNYVVASPSWNSVGAVTWGNGNTGVVGLVSAGNSLVGTHGGDAIGTEGVTALANGNYVVASAHRFYGEQTCAGAVTWGDGSKGISGPVTAENSLIGTDLNTYVGSGGVVALKSGNFVAVSPSWSNDTIIDAGAVTWGDGSTGIFGSVSASNSLVGTTRNDAVGAAGVTALSNGNYVVASDGWNFSRGAVTWGNGGTGISGVVSASNSLIGTTAGDAIGFKVAALANGNYVVGSPYWGNGAAYDAGAATWGDGNKGVSGAISDTNSLVGKTAVDFIGFGVTALSDGNFVVTSPYWNNGGAQTYFGAVTLGNGYTGITGSVSARNSLVGTTVNDYVGNWDVVALSDGNYVATSISWNSVSAASVGAVTWGNGHTGVVGPVSIGNSLVGSTGSDQIGLGKVAVLSNGGYVVASPSWNSTDASQVGAVTYASGGNPLVSVVSKANSFLGTAPFDRVGESGIVPLKDGNYVIVSHYWSNDALSNAGAITLAKGSYRLVGTVKPWNSVIGGVAHVGSSMNFDYDATRHQLVVGRVAENIVSLFTMDQIFAENFES